MTLSIVVRIHAPQLAILALLFFASACGAGLPDQLDARCTEASASATGGTPTLVAFARQRLGQQVERGECTDLVTAGLAALGYEPFSALGPVGPTADYVWGTPVTTLTASRRDTAGILPGDVLQFRDFEQAVALSDGTAWKTSASHHTAVVSAVSGVVCTYEQNVGGRRTVGRGAVDPAGLLAGTVRVFRPILH